MTNIKLSNKLNKSLESKIIIISPVYLKFSVFLEMIEDCSKLLFISRKQFLNWWLEFNIIKPFLQILIVLTFLLIFVKCWRYLSESEHDIECKEVRNWIYFFFPEILLLFFKFFLLFLFFFLALFLLFFVLEIFVEFLALLLHEFIHFLFLLLFLFFALFGLLLIL
jgi:hypothetical protein